MRPRNTSVSPTPPRTHPLQRIRWWYVLLLLVGGVFVVRAFYLQVIRHDYYQKVAFSNQLKQYEIPAERGIISARNGDQVVPLVLNETLYTLFADPKYIKDPALAAQKVQGVIGGNPSDYEALMRTPNTRYVILAKKLNKDQASKIADLNLKGIGTRDAQYRTYPDGSLAAQLLGFVNDDGEGKYGIEQALNDQLEGKPGQLRAITDAQGVPLPANRDNVVQDPVAGKHVVLTLDVSMQQQLEDILQQGLKNANSTSGSALIIDVNSGAVKAMANFPTYDPSQYFKVEDPSLFNNAAVSSPLETGSIMKLLTTSAAIDTGAINKDSTYYDPGSYQIDGATVTNVEGGAIVGPHSIQDILTLSLNTGATWELMQMGGGQINQKARDTWHDYMVNHFHLGSPTGIEQGFESAGVIPDPDNGYGLNIQYANTAFGQGLLATPLQMGAAVAAVLNGGTYYQPHVVEGYLDGSGNETKQQPKVWKQGIVKASTSEALRELMEGVYSHNYRLYKSPAPTSAYSIGGKTGTAEIARPEGGYYPDRYNGTFIGFIGGDTPQYVVVIRVNEPHVAGYAGAGAAAPVFGSIVSMLINSAAVTPKS